MIAQQERDEIEEVVRQVLDSLGGDKPSPLWSGNAGAFFAIRSLAPSDWRVKSAATRVELLEVSSVAGDRATVRSKPASSRRSSIRSSANATQSFESRAPPSCERSSDGWKLLTLAIDGVDSRLPSSCRFRRKRRSATCDRRGRALAGAERRAHGRGRNEGTRAAELDSVFAGGRVWLLFEDGGLLLRQRTLEPGEVTARSVG